MEPVTAIRGTGEHYRWVGLGSRRGGSYREDMPDFDDELTPVPDSTLDLADLAGSMPSFVLGDVPSGLRALRLPQPRRAPHVDIPEKCQQFVAGLDSYGD
jgi:hypothetical protein